MAATTLTEIPASMVAGDTLLFTQDFSDYQSPTWSLSFSLRKHGGGVGITWTTTANGDGRHLCTIAMADSASYVPGSYSVIGFVTNGTQRFKVYDGEMEIKPDYLSSDDTIDPRSAARVTLGKLETAFDTLATTTASSVSVEGVTYTRRSMDELQRMISVYRAKVDNELLDHTQNQDKYRRRIVCRFTKPT